MEQAPSGSYTATFEEMQQIFILAWVIVAMIVINREIIRQAYFFIHFKYTPQMRAKSTLYHTHTHTHNFKTKTLRNLDVMIEIIDRDNPEIRLVFSLSLGDSMMFQA